MSRKMKIPSIFKHKEPKQPWQWPSCKHPKTLFFRATNDDVFKTVNSVFLDTCDGVETSDSWFTNSSECASTFSEHSEANNNANFSAAESSVETIIRGVRSSERLLFEPGDTSAILKESKGTTVSEEFGSPFKESMALAMESDDPYSDFRRSMQEMVESHGMKDWECLEELLGWYLRMNGKTNHGFIVGAFVDLLVGLADGNNNNNNNQNSYDCLGSSTAACCSDTTSYSSAESCFSSPCSPVSDPTTVGAVVLSEDRR